MGTKKKLANSEQKYVLEPVKDWFENQKAGWVLYTPRNATDTGWDIEARRKNQDLLIEAKYIKHSFISSFSQLVTSPLTNRAQHF